MKYMLMMQAQHGSGYWEITQWAAEDFNAHLEYMKDLYRKLTESGELVGAEGLAPPKEARMVRAGRGGRPIVTDGPFAETKEFIAGFWIVSVDTPERAYEIAAEASSAPGPGGEPLIIPIEVRQVPDAPPSPH
ncbi:MAG: YciI family protein [Acidobacteriota bacterium]|nr:YciI family protein [Acidobacteriota bacterium]